MKNHFSTISIETKILQNGLSINVQFCKENLKLERKRADSIAGNLSPWEFEPHGLKTICKTKEQFVVLFWLTCGKKTSLFKKMNNF